MKKTLIIITCILITLSCSKQEKSQPNSQKSENTTFDYKNINDVKLFLKTKVDGDMFSDKITLRYIGNPNNDLTNYYVYLSELIWGESLRSTKRLVLLSPDGKYVGQYSHFAEDGLYFVGPMIQCSNVEPNSTGWDFSKAEPPERVVIDGEDAEFYVK